MTKEKLVDLLNWIPDIYEIKVRYVQPNNHFVDEYKIDTNDIETDHVKNVVYLNLKL
jgi:hypothetical protein